MNDVAVESQNAVEDSQNKENVNGSGGFIVLQTQLHWLSVPTLGEILLLCKKSLTDQDCLY